MARSERQSAADAREPRSHWFRVLWFTFIPHFLLVIILYASIVSCNAFGGGAGPDGNTGGIVYLVLVLFVSPFILFIAGVFLFSAWFATQPREFWASRFVSTGQSWLVSFAGLAFIVSAYLVIFTTLFGLQKLLS